MVQVQEDVKRLLTESKVLAMKSRMERLILAIGDGRNKDRETTPDPAPTGERKRTLGVLPSFITGTTDFILHLEAFRDYCVLNEFNVAEKVKRPNDPRSNGLPALLRLVVRQAFHERKQKAGELAADYAMKKYSLFKRGLSSRPLHSASTMRQRQQASWTRV